MADNQKNNHWRWKGSTNDQDRSRRDEINRHDGNQDNAVIYRKKNNEQQRRRKKKMKKRWSVGPDVNLALVPRGKQCQIITAVIFIFFGLFLAVAGLVVLLILQNISRVVWGVGIAMLVVGIVVLIAGLLYMLCKCCCRTSTRYKQYKAQFKAGGKFEMSDASGQLPETTIASPKTSPETQGTNQEFVGRQRDHVTEQSSDASSRTYVTANDQTLSMPSSSTRLESTSQWNTPRGYRPIHGEDDHSDLQMQRGDDHGALNGHQGAQRRGVSSSDKTHEDTLRDDFDKLEEVLREMVMNKSGTEQEVAHLMGGPNYTSTPVSHGVRRQPGVHTGVFMVPIVVEGDPRATPPTNPIPPSYDQVLRNYRTYSRSASPTRLMESDI